MLRPRMDVVIPVFNEQEIIELLHRRVTLACERTKLDYCIIYVDDGSTDQTVDWLVANAINATDLRGSVQLIRLSRNFGQPAAIMAGLQASRAEVVILMDGDLQDPPELIPQLIDRWRAGDEIVIAQRTSRDETFFRGLAFKAFHSLFRYLADSKIPPNTGTFCLLNRTAVEAIGSLPESHRFFPGLRAWVGFRQSNLLFQRPPRAGGQPKQTFSRLFRYALDAVFGYSLKPLRVLTGSGVLICSAAFAMMIWFIFKRLIGWESASMGFTTLTCAVFGLGGFQLVGLGILGEYIGRIYDEVKGRPAFIVSQEIRSVNNSRELTSDVRGVVRRKAG